MLGPRGGRNRLRQKQNNRWKSKQINVSKGRRASLQNLESSFLKENKRKRGRLEREVEQRGASSESGCQSTSPLADPRKR